MDNPPNSRLFIVCAKTHTEEEMREHFEKFGPIEDIWCVKDKVTNKSKGVCYVKYTKFSNAAKAMEESDGRPLPGQSNNRTIKVGIIRDLVCIWGIGSDKKLWRSRMGDLCFR